MNTVVKVIASCFVAVACTIVAAVFISVLNYIGPRWDWTTGISQLVVWSLVLGIALVLSGGIFGILKIVGFFDDEENTECVSTKSECEVATRRFDVNKYLSRIEAEADKLLSQPKELYDMILWAGLDGFKINADGSTEWVKKHESEVQKGESVKKLTSTSLDLPDFLSAGFRYGAELTHLGHPTLCYFNGKCFVELPELEHISLPSALRDSGQVFRWAFYSSSNTHNVRNQLEQLVGREIVFMVAYPDLADVFIFKAVTRFGGSLDRSGAFGLSMVVESVSDIRSIRDKAAREFISPLDLSSPYTSYYQGIRLGKENPVEPEQHNSTQNIKNFNPIGEAVGICNKVLAHFPASEAAIKIKNDLQLAIEALEEENLRLPTCDLGSTEYVEYIPSTSVAALKISSILMSDELKRVKQIADSIDRLRVTLPYSLQPKQVQQIANCTMNIGATIMAQTQSLDNNIKCLQLQLAQQVQNQSIIDSLNAFAPLQSTAESLTRRL